MKGKSEPANERASERGGAAAAASGRVVVRTFRDLLVWQRAMELAETVYASTAAFPKDERFGLVLQMRRAAVSVPSNIAEGHARQARADYIRMLRIARGSLAELETQTLLAERLGWLPDEGPERRLQREVAAMLHALIVKLESKPRRAAEVNP